MAYETTIRIKELNDLPLIISYDIGEPQRDVGIMHEYIDEWDVIGIGSRYFRRNENCNWIYNKIRPFHQQIGDAIAENHWDY